MLARTIYRAGASQRHLVVESGIISIVSVIDLPFVIDDSEEIILIHCFRTGIPDLEN